MRGDTRQTGLEELRAVRKESRRLFWFVGLLSLVCNLLVLTGPIYMLQVYDGVLTSGSVETLVALTALVVFLYVLMGLVDLMRQRVLNRISQRFQNSLERRVFDAHMRKAAVLPTAGTQSAVSDLETVKQAIGSPAVVALYDLPWTPAFFALMFVFHPVLGLAGLFGAGVLLALTAANRALSNRHLDGEAEKSHAAAQFGQMLHDNADFVQAAGMAAAARGRWLARQAKARMHDIKSDDITSAFSVVTRTFRMFLQSGMLGLGAWLVITGSMTAGGMIAGSVVLGRALSPIETLLNQWKQLQSGMTSWGRLADLLGEVPPPAPRTDLPAPKAVLNVKGVSVVPPGERKATLKSLSFDVAPGEALGVIGPSGAGKSSLARALAGLWPPVGGYIRLDGASLDQYDPDVLGRHIGYLPQQVTLFDGTLADNIARLEMSPDDEKVVAAAKMAGAHEMILSLPQGYDTPVQAGNLRLSGGQLQRIGLARALYDNPVLVVLDEPNANLDSAGSAALNAAIKSMKAQGSAVIIMAHRPAAIRECDKLLVMENGMRTSFGARDDVLKGLVSKTQSAKPAEMAGLS